jgi:hypothetical protein
VSKPDCCKRPAWAAELDLGSARGFEYALGRCAACGAYRMNVFCVATGITGFEPVTASDIERLRAARDSPELKALLCDWEDANL